MKISSPKDFSLVQKEEKKTSTQVQYKWPHLWVDFSFWASVVRNKIDLFFEWNCSRTLNPSQTVLHQFSFGERHIFNKGKAKICWSLKMTTMLAQIPFEALRQHSAIFFLSVFPDVHVSPILFLVPFLAEMMFRVRSAYYNVSFSSERVCATLSSHRGHLK